MSFYLNTTPAHLQWHISQPPLSHPTLERVSCFKYPGAPLDETVSMTPLKDDILDKIRKSIGKLSNTFNSLRSSFPEFSTIDQPCVHHLARVSSSGARVFWSKPPRT